MRYKLIATDVDGTLLGSDSVLTKATQRAMERVSKTDVLFTISTGRPVVGVKQFADILKKDLPFIVFNGAVAVMSKSGEIIYRQGLSIETAKEIADIGKSFGTTIAIWTDRQLYAFELNERILEYKKINGTEPKIIKEIGDLKDEAIIKLLWYDDIDKIEKYQRQMRLKFDGRVNCHTSRPYFLEFVDLNASKAIALDKIGKRFGIRPEEMVAVGDGFNDISMIKYAGLGAAMGNAPDEVKQAADIVALSNDEDGVANIIEKYILNQGGK